MRLKKIELQGFKTFASKAALEFSPGLTAIVGPNGSGKSNVTDAVRWVLGEQSLRLLRGRRTEDVIFGGGTGRAPAGLAEVTLTLDNEDGALPPEYAEVSIGRRAHRSGENEYFINRSKVRLRDVVDLLSRAGVGQSGHSVVGQGLVDQALSQRPEERRSLFEDAAGMRRYQAKKGEAETKLAEVHANTTRVQDLIAELEPRLVQLARQARRAQDESRLREQWQTAARRFYGHQRFEIEKALAEWRPEIERLEAVRTESEGEARAAAAALAEAREQLQALRTALGTQEGEHTAAREGLDAARREAAVAHERLAGAERYAQDLRARVAQLEERVRDAETALPGIESALLEATQALAGARAEAELAARALDEAPEVSDPQAAETARRELVTRARDLTQAVTQLREAERQLRDLTRQTEESASGRQRAQSALEAQRVAVAQLERSLAEQTRRSETLEAERQRASAAHSAARERSAAASARLAAHEQEAQELRVRLSVLREVVRGAEHAGPESVGETLAEQLRIPAEVEAAVAAALGEALDWVVVESDVDARERARRHAAEGGRRRTFVARDALAAAQRVTQDGAGTEGRLDEIALGPEADAAQRRLLAAAYVVRDLETALRLADRAAPAARPLYVTLAGELVNELGAITVGAAPDEAAVLRHLREMRETESRLASLSGETEPLGREVEEARAALAATEADLAKVEVEQRAVQHESSRLAGEQRGLGQQQLRLERDAAWWGEFADRAALQLAELQERMARLEDQRREAETLHQEAERRAAHLSANADEREQALDALRDRAAGARTALALAEQRLAQAERELETARATAGGAALELTAARDRLAEAETQVGALRETAARAQEAVAEAAASLTEVEARFHEQSGESRALDEEIERHRTAHEEAQHRGDTAARDLALLDAQRAALIERSRALQEQAERDLGELPEALQDEAGLDALRQRVQSLDTRLRNLGPVNQVAMQEHEEESERLAFLKRELTDLHNAARSLEEVRAELDRGLEQDFGVTFNAVAEHFRTYFVRLFGGGDARLQLTDAQNVSEAGVEIIVQLPGKRKQELAVLSGGERSLVAAALLFALLKAKPSPFCVLDEVDAALDEANVGRFCDALAELATETQFVVVTHNRATMERAGALYGVTLGPDGVSRVVSLRLEEAVGRANVNGAGNGQTNGHAAGQSSVAAAN
ncbi:MAG TPA: chromosome segregation protein SMC [Chloroflexota bacterium]|nr:chromosome segregation protein SMC [Chloroflexota bacterium]